MPEGDTIRRLAERITTRFAGSAVRRCVTRDPRLVGVDFTGSELVDADAVGKHLLVRFSDGRSLHAHLRMDGRFLVGPAATGPVLRRRLELWFDGGRLTALDVPVLGVVATAAEETVVGHLGPDLCAAEPPDLAEVTARLQRDGAAPLAGALLDQRNVAGFGNVYAVELPFVSGVSPNQPIGSIAGLDDLVAVGTAMIRGHAVRGPRNTTGRNLHRPEHWVYGRAGGRCPICATRVDSWSELDSPWRRNSVWCPSCQPELPAVAVDTARLAKLLALHPARRALGR